MQLARRKQRCAGELLRSSFSNVTVPAGAPGTRRLSLEVVFLKSASQLDPSRKPRSTPLQS
jgi:hypothetical protein